METIHKEEGYPLALFDTYLALIKGSVGSSQYRRLYVATENGPHEVIGDGDLACAYFVSSILTLCRLMQDGVHTTVAETVLDLHRSGWQQISELRQGAVIVWEPKLCSDKKCHAHIGFFLQDDIAISNDADSRSPMHHHMTYGKEDDKPKRVIEAIYFHEHLKR